MRHLHDYGKNVCETLRNIKKTYFVSIKTAIDFVCCRFCIIFANRNRIQEERWTHTRTLYCNTRQRRTHSLWITSGVGRKQEPVRCRTDTGGVCRIQEVVIGSNSYLNTLFTSNKCCVFITWYVTYLAIPSIG